MDNGILVFMIIALGVVVVWQTSKLKQYERFEKMLPGEQPGPQSSRETGDASAQANSDATVRPAASLPVDSGNAEAFAAGTVSGASGAATGREPVTGQPRARTIAELADAQSAVRLATGEGASVSHGKVADSGRADDNVEEAKRVQLVMARCHYADFYVDQLDDDYERDQFSRIVDECIDLSRRIDDPFLQATALQPLIMLMQKAGWDAKQELLMGEVRDDLVRQRIEAALLEEEAVEA